MKINLTLNYQSIKYEVLCEIGIEDSKKEYLVYLKAVDEGTGNIVDYIHEKLLNKFPISTAKNVIMELQALLLVDQNHEITDAGKEALDTGTIFEPTKGVYAIEIVKNTPLESSIINLSQQKIYGSDSEVDKAVFKEINKTIKLHNKQNIRLLHIDPSGRISKKGEPVQIQLTFDRNEWKVYLKIRNQATKMELSDDFYDIDLTNIILDNFEFATGNPQAILKDVNGLSDKEIIEFRGNQEIRGLNISKYGRITNVMIEDIQYLPRNDIEANKWAKRLFLLRYLNDYSTETDIKANWDYMINENQTFLSYSLRLPTVKELLGNITNKQQQWYVQAPLDFDLEAAI